MGRRRAAGWLLCLLVVGGLSGCKKVTQEQVNVVHTGAMAAKERAAAFAVIAPLITAKDQRSAAAVATWITQHQAGLNAQAKSLSDLSQALVYRPVVNEITVKALSDCAETASERTRNFTAMLAHVTVKDPGTPAEWLAFAGAHERALASQAELLRSIAEPLKAKIKKQATEVQP